ncbi:hypothetical protein HMPREF1628_08675 [Actinomyces sp. S4-C9]|nr:hypothetical protein HMPREF1628_08675 [Actinomyces sp. S4-C9]
MGAVDEQDDALSVVGVADAEVAYFSGVAQGDFAVVVYPVVSHSLVGVVKCDGGLVFGGGGVGLVGCAPVDGSVFSLGVVDGLEVLELLL